MLLALYVFGIGKAAVMPLHFWLPAAMVAPTPVSALLHAVAVVKAGVFAIVKVCVMIFGVDTLSAHGTIGLAHGGRGRHRRDRLPGRAQAGQSQTAACLFDGLAALLCRARRRDPGADLGRSARPCTSLRMRVSKITLFFAAGSIYTAAHLTEISQLDGIGRRMPWTMGAFAIGALGMIGLPPTAGFLGKWFMLTGSDADSQLDRGRRHRRRARCSTRSTSCRSCYRAFFREPAAVWARKTTSRRSALADRGRR